MGKDSWPLDYDEQGKLRKRSPVSGELVPLDDKELSGWIDADRLAIDSEYESICDPANERPFGKEFMWRRSDFIAWMRGEMPSYRPTVYEVEVLRPGYLERQERIKEIGLRAGGNGTPPPASEGDDVALKTQKKTRRVFRLRDLWVHVLGFDTHGRDYGAPATEQAGLKTEWRALRHQLKKWGPAGQSDRELLEAWLDHLEHDKGFNRTDLLNVPLDDWRGLLADPSPPVPELVSPLTENDRDLLRTMVELSATSLKPESGSVIVRTALYRGDEKRAFNNLKRNELVGSKCGKSGGYWLTSRGETVAKSIQSNGATE